MDNLPISGYPFSVNTENTELTNEDLIHLIKRIAQHDSAAFQQFYASHAGLLYSTIYRVLNDHEDSQDVLQEVSMQLWLKAELYEPSKGKPLTWVTTMARNRAIDRLRAKKRRYRLNDTFEDQLIGEDRVAKNEGLENLQRSELSETMHTAVRQLNPTQQEVIKLTYFEGLTQAEAATRLDQPLGTVKARIRRGLMKLRSASDYS
jgi:RNA polymerase sigma-70 factor (ECF subfamily)